MTEMTLVQAGRYVEINCPLKQLSVAIGSVHRGEFKALFSSLHLWLQYRDYHFYQERAVYLKSKLSCT